MDPLGVFILIGACSLMIIVLASVVTMYAVKLNRYRRTANRVLQHLGAVKCATEEQEYHLVCAKNMVVNIME